MKVTDEMVSRFLTWELPRGFAPDCGISFDGRHDDEWNKNKPWPVGTNLLTAEQARAMLEHVLAETEGHKSGGVFESVREQQRGLSHWPDSLHAAWFKWSSTPAYAGFLRDVPIQLRPCALRFVQAAFEEAAKLPPKSDSADREFELRLLEAAHCPTCDNTGTTPQGDECEWCFHRKRAVAHLKSPPKPNCSEGPCKK